MPLPETSEPYPIDSSFIDLTLFFYSRNTQESFTVKRYVNLATLSIITAALLTTMANAQAPASMNSADMQKMMQGAQAMQACMKNIDQSAMQRLSAESEQLHTDIKALCATGKRDKAQSKVLAFSKQAAKDPAMKAMAECGKQMQGIMPKQALPYADAEHEYADRHVCDSP